ncbi:MAG: N-6 DNA methylase, partial [Syntrophobacterales bacterium]|nr:N-6 DNA methylase [Syntrophobacterales bacterium]
MAFTAISIEGGLFPGDLLERLAAGAETAGQRPEDFGLPKGRRLSDEMQAAFADLRSLWDAFQRRLSFSKESSTTLTREAWVIPVLERLGYDLVFQRRAALVGGDAFAFSHRAGEDPEAPPVHVVGHDQPLDRKGDARRSPHALVQEYLNRADALWGLVTNGRKLRLLRHSARLARPTYLEFDLEALLTAHLYSEFVLLYRLLHRSRLPRSAAEAHECWLEKYYQQGIEEGGRVREHLRDGVEEALKQLGTAFLSHPNNEPLRQALEAGRLDGPGFYRQLLRLIYRLLFLMVAEERRLLFPPEAPHRGRQAIYLRYYSLSRLRERCEAALAPDPFGDLWEGLKQTFRLFREEEAARALGLAPLDGELFKREVCPDLEEAFCDNPALLTALFYLSTFTDGRVRRRVNYAALDVEELGSIYESLLDYHPVVSLNPPAFDLVWGSERKQTGSYYTPPELVRELIESALVPVLHDRLAAAQTREEKEKALLSLKVCDPASGSGHFLLAAARRLGRELARVRTGEDEPAPSAYREAVRDIIRECLYAVDKNPLAVDLCKLALWLEGHFPGLPLSFLDHHIKCGDSLVGVFDLGVLKEGIPDAAYTQVTGDDRQVASRLKRRNREEREGQGSLFREAIARAVGRPRALAPEFAALASLAESKPEDVQAKEELYHTLRRGNAWWRLKVACDLWTGAFFASLNTSRAEANPSAPTTGLLWRYLSQGQADPRAEGRALALSQENRFFHWPLEFPEVFAAGGFDVVLGNPPWERLKLQEQEFFAGRDPEIARAPSKAARERLIRRLPETNPGLWAEFQQAKHQAEAQSLFVRQGGRFPLCGRGDINTYAVFAELMRGLLHPRGRAGIIVPTGIATDDTTKFFFQDLMAKGSLVSLYDFENRQKIFPGIDSRIKFCLLTLAGPGDSAAGAQFAFFLQEIADLKDEARQLTLTAQDLALLNPNTRTCPICRSRRDYEITKGIYERVPVLIQDGPPEVNPWGISFLCMIHMANDSRLFRTREQLEGEGWTLSGNVFLQNVADGFSRRSGSVAEGSSPAQAEACGYQDRYLPLYEAKMMHHFDHRWATYEGTKTREVTLREKQDPDFVVLPRYWVPEPEVTARSARAPRELGRAWLGRKAEEVQQILAAWWLGAAVLSGLEPPRPLLELQARLGLNTTKAKKWGEAFPLSPAELQALPARAPALADADASGLLTLAGQVLRERTPPFLLGWRDITNATNERTVIAGVLPWVGVGDKFLLMFPKIDTNKYFILLTNLNCL